MAFTWVIQFNCNQRYHKYNCKKFKTSQRTEKLHEYQIAYLEINIRNGQYDSSIQSPICDKSIKACYIIPRLDLLVYQRIQWWSQPSFCLFPWREDFITRLPRNSFTQFSVVEKVIMGPIVQRGTVKHDKMKRAEIHKRSIIWKDARRHASTFCIFVTQRFKYSLV